MPLLFHMETRMRRYRPCFVVCLLVACHCLRWAFSGDYGDLRMQSKIDGWQRSMPDISLTIDTMSYFDGRSGKGYAEYASTTNFVVRKELNYNRVHYSATRVSEIFNSSVPGTATTVFYEDLPYLYSYTRDGESQEILLSDQGSKFEDSINAYVATLPRIDNPARGKWTDTITPIPQFSEYIAKPLSVDYTCHEKEIRGRPYLLSTFVTESFEQKLPGEVRFRGIVTGVALERASKDKSPFVACKLSGEIYSVGGESLGRVEMQSHSYRSGPDLESFQWLAQDEAVIDAFCETVFSLNPAAFTEDRLRHLEEGFPSLAVRPSWRDALRESMSVVTMCAMLQLEMRTNSFLDNVLTPVGNFLISSGKKLGQGTKKARKEMDALSISDKLGTPFRIVVATIDNLAGPCVEALGHIVKGDMKSATKVVDKAYWEFYSEAIPIYANEVGKSVIGYMELDPSTPRWAIPLAKGAGKYWDKIMSEVKSRLSGKRRAAAPVEPRAPSPAKPSPPPAKPAPKRSEAAKKPEPRPAPRPPAKAEAPTIVDKDIEGVWANRLELDMGYGVLIFLDPYVDQYCMAIYGGNLNNRQRVMGFSDVSYDGSILRFAAGDGRTVKEMVVMRRVGRNELTGRFQGKTETWRRKSAMTNEQRLLALDLLLFRAQERLGDALSSKDRSRIAKAEREYFEVIEKIKHIEKSK